MLSNPDGNREKKERLIMSEQYNYGLLQSYGEDIYISRNVEIRRPGLISIGNHVAIDTGFYCTTRVDIMDYVHIAPYVTVIGGAEGYLRMGHFSGMAAGCRIICGSEEYLGEGLIGPTIPIKYRDNLKIAPVIFEMSVTIATDVVVMPGVTLAEGSVVGALSLVTKDTEPWTIYRGIPAKPIKNRPKEKMIQAAKEMGYL